MAKTDASAKLKTGDLLLAVNGKLMTNFRYTISFSFLITIRDVEKATINESKVELTILRKQKEEKIVVETTLLNGEGTNKVVCWGGALLQNTHR